MQLCKTINKLTGEKRYYADGIRLSRDNYELYESIYKRWDTLYSTGTKILDRDFKNVSLLRA